MPPRLTPKARKILARDHLPRAPIGREVQRRVLDLGLTRAQAAVLVRDAASQLSRLMVGHLHEFSADRLVGMLVRLGSDVEVVIRHPRGRRRAGNVRVRVMRER